MSTLPKEAGKPSTQLPWGKSILGRGRTAEAQRLKCSGGSGSRIQDWGRGSQGPVYVPSCTSRKELSSIQNIVRSHQKVLSRRVTSSPF